MEVQVVEYKRTKKVILLDDDMRIITPVYEFLEYQRLKSLELNTLKANASDLRTFWKFLKETGDVYDEVTPRIILEFIDYLRCGDDDVTVLYKESARTGKTINRILSSVHMFYIYHATISETDNPIVSRDIRRGPNMFKSLLEHARGDNNTEQSLFKVKESEYVVKLLTDDEAVTTLNALNRKRDKLLFKILYLTGARIQEILDLEIESVPVPDSSQAIGIFQQIKSKGKRRDLYVPMSLIEELDDFIFQERDKIKTEHSFIFVSEQPQNLGKQLTYRGIYDVFKRVQGKTGIYFNFHDLRHTFNSDYTEMGMDVSIRKILLGHEHIATTDKYTHLSKEFISNTLLTYYAKRPSLGGTNDDK